MPGPSVHVDLSNTLSVPFLSGIQRVSRELVVRLRSADDPAVVAIRSWGPDPMQFRTLSRTEWVRLEQNTVAPQHLGARLRARAHRALIDPVRRSSVVERAATAVDHGRHRIVTSGAWFDLEASWHAPADRSELLPRLAAEGIATGAMVFDLLPLERPDWFAPTNVERFTRTMSAHLEYSEFFVCISQHIASRLLATTPVDPAHVHVLQLAGATRLHDEIGEPPEDLRLLMVATIEPRKNHRLAIELFDRLSEIEPSVSFQLIGRAGWLADDVVERIRSHPQFGQRLVWHEVVSEQNLDAAYRRASVVLVPSFDEGFGLPIAEATSRNIPVIANDVPVLREIGGDAIRYASSIEEWLGHIEELRSVDAQRCERRRLHEREQPTWEDAASTLHDLFARHLTA